MLKSLKSMKLRLRIMGYLSTVGILTFLMGVVLFITGNRSKGQMSGEYGRGKGAFKGPVWFLLMVLGIFLIVLDPFIPV
jgi:hypothetical protein